MQVLPVANRDVIALDADDIVRLMRRAGFSDEQIIDAGTELRNSLATSGGASIRTGDRVQAVFAVDGNCVHVSSHQTGSAIYDVESGRFR